MTTAYVVVNNYQNSESLGDSTEILGIALDPSRADDILDDVVENLDGNWTEGHTVFQSNTDGLEFDSYYIDKYEVTE